MYGLRRSPMQSMRSDSDRYRLIHIRDNIAKAMLFVEGMSYEQFRDDAKSLYAATRALEIISEASRSLSVELKTRLRKYPGRTWPVPAASTGTTMRT